MLLKTFRWFCLGSFASFAFAGEPVMTLSMEGNCVATKGSANLLFRFARTNQAVHTPIRYKFKLDNYDDTWKERCDVMRILVMFQDAENKLLGMEQILFSHESEGWTGSVETSPMIPGSKTFTVPEKTTSAMFTLTSAGSAAVVGTIALGDFRVLEMDAQGASTPMPRLSFTTNMFAQLGKQPHLFIKAGNNRSLATALPAVHAPGGHALAILDTDATSHADWQTVWLPLSSPGTKQLRLEWLICYSFGTSDVPSISYTGLMPGQYCFRVRPLSALGNPLSEELSMNLQIRLPFWKHPLFLFLCVLLVLGLVFGATRYYYHQRSRRIIAQLEQQRALEQERMRIARDIHDDLGSTLSQIAMLSQPLPAHAPPEKATQMLARINKATLQMAVTMDEIVWTLNPKKDRLDYVLNYFDAYAQEYLSLSDIEFKFSYPPVLPQTPMNSMLRHHLFLAFKEALSNAVKHAQCKTISMHYEPHGEGFVLSLSDDGIGFDTAQSSPLGNGLDNMKQRLEDIGGECRIESSPGNGTRISFLFEKLD
jgi:signal transduction histidine kinase